MANIKETCTVWELLDKRVRGPINRETFIERITVLENDYKKSGVHKIVAEWRSFLKGKRIRIGD